MKHSVKEKAQQSQSVAIQSGMTEDKRVDAHQYKGLRADIVRQSQPHYSVQQDSAADTSSLQSVIQNHSRSTHIAQVKNSIESSPRVLAQRKSMEQIGAALQFARMNINDDPALEHEADVMGEKARELGNKTAVQQLKEDTSKGSDRLKGNDPMTGFPYLLKAGFSAMGHDINPRVHYNSNKPAQLNALAYAQGNDIHLAAGQEQHLPHEAWHVVQQQQGRVRSHQQFYGQENRQTPLSLGEPSGYSQDGIVTTTMSNEAYANWRDTVQCKMSLHGACSVGGKTIVTQFRSASDILQMVGLSKKVKAYLVIAEGILTVAAGAAAAILSGGIAAIPGIIAASVGIVKVVRGCFMLKENPNKAVIDALRAVEAAAAIVGGAIAGNPAIIVFGVAKAIRSLLIAITDWMGEETKKPAIRKALMAIATLAHSVEVVALGFAGGSTIAGAGDIATVAGGIAVAGVAVSKGVRTVDQGIGAYNAKSGKESESESESEAEASWTAPTTRPPRTEPEWVT